MPDGGKTSRQDIAATTIQVADLDRMSAEWAESVVRKDAIWPNPDWRSLVEEGMEPRAAAMIKLLRDRLPVRPPYGVRQMGTHHSSNAARPNEAVRRDYVEMMSLVQEHLMRCRTAEEVRNARTGILAAVGWSPRASHELRHKVISVWRERTDTLQVDYRDAIKAEQMVRTGWPEQTQKRSPRCQRPAVDATNKPIALPLPQRPVLDEPTREGLPPRRFADINLVNILDHFGLRAIEFGKAVPEQERDVFLGRVWDSLEDLAELLGIPPSAIGLGGTISMAFATRGIGSPADYQPGERVMAIARTGSGALAHCWAMAFDHWCGDPTGVAPGGIPRTASGPSERRKTDPLKNPSLPPEQAQAWAALDATIWRSNPEIHLEAASVRIELDAMEDQVAQVDAQRTTVVSQIRGREPDADERQYLAQSEQWLAARRTVDLPALRRAAATAAAANAESGESEYGREARKLATGGAEHWVAPSRVFARTIEATLMDRLDAKGARSDYLVHSAEAHRFQEEFRGNPYPTGAERERIAAAIDKLMAATLPSMAIGFVAETALPEENSSLNSDPVDGLEPNPGMEDLRKIIAS